MSIVPSLSTSPTEFVRPLVHWSAPVCSTSSRSEKRLWNWYADISQPVRGFLLTSTSQHKIELEECNQRRLARRRDSQAPAIEARKVEFVVKFISTFATIRSSQPLLVQDHVSPSIAV